jgi:hypothetical protein
MLLTSSVERLWFVAMVQSYTIYILFILENMACYAILHAEEGLKHGHRSLFALCWNRFTVGTTLYSLNKPLSLSTHGGEKSLLAVVTQQFHYAEDEESQHADPYTPGTKLQRKSKQIHFLIKISVREKNITRNTTK